MGAAEQRAKSAAMAADMKAKGIKRRTGQCPWGCGAGIPNGGEPLISHLGRCHGGGEKKRDAMLRRRR